MSMIKKIVLIALYVATSCQAMVFDNRFFPLIQYPYITVPDRPSHASLALFATTASNAFGQNEQEIGLPVLFGPYDQREIARALVCIGCDNPLRSMFQLIELPWKMEGKIQSQGISWSWQQALTNHISFGFYSMAMRMNSRIDFNCDINTVTPDERQELIDEREHIHQLIGLRCAHADEAGLGDTELYLRLSNDWDYALKFRRIEAGIRAGVLIPTGVVQDPFVAFSVPFGGNGHWGVYSSLDAEFELKEDWKCGLLFRVSKRLARTCLRRMPVCKEPIIFGAIVAPALVDPGFTTIVSPYLSFENLREGFGVRIQYTFIDHQKDCWQKACVDEKIPINFKVLNDRSEWRSSYITLNAFYDFGKMKVCRGFEPILIFSWDVPVNFFDAHSVSKTNKIALTLEYNF